MTNILEILQDVADEVGIQRPTSVVGSREAEVQKMLRQAHKVGDWIKTQATWQQLRKEHAFTAVHGQDQPGAIPEDFDRFVPEAFWDRTNEYLVSGPITSVEWQALTALDYKSVARKFIYRNNPVSVVPAFDGGEDLVFEYVSKNWIDTDDDGVADARRFQADTNVPIIEPELITYGVIYEYYESEGFDDQARQAKQKFERRLTAQLKNDQPSSTVMIAGDIFGGRRHFTGTPPAGVTGRVFD